MLLLYLWCCYNVLDPGVVGKKAGKGEEVGRLWGGERMQLVGCQLPAEELGCRFCLTE